MSTTLSGISGSPGVAIGRVVLLGSALHKVGRRLVAPHEVDQELSRFESATARAKEELRSLVAGLSDKPHAHAVLEAYVLMIDDPLLTSAVKERIATLHHAAEWSVIQAIEDLSAQMARADDPYLRERSRDIEFIGEHLLRAFGRDKDESGHKSTPPGGAAILVARDLSPADTAGYGSSFVAFVTERGSRTSHTSITARALKIPAVVGVGDICRMATHGELVIVDGLRGTVILDPSAEELREAELRAERVRARARDLTSSRHAATRTRCGADLALRANVEVPEEAREADEEGALGVGLYRTEYLYIDRAHPPTEEEQLTAFRSVVETVHGHPVVLRTFDIGGDKFASTFKLPLELNPMLGLRAIRLAEARPELFLTHLRAMVRASAFGDVRIMVPMVSSLTELRWAREMLDRVVAELRSEGHDLRAPPLGVMIEVPSAAVMADLFAREAAFMSIGTNDLIQYTLAVDRSSRSLAYLASPFDPAIARMIATVVEAGARHACSVSVCGAMAGDPLSACLLLGLGVREFSMEVASLAEIRETFRRIDLDLAAGLARQALTLSTATEVEQAFVRALEPRLHDLLTGDEDRIEESE
jgi:phosphoenolpyruvate-protein phosphotransferase (PTS system enzyme I)